MLDTTLATTEIFDPVSDTWSGGPTMSTSRMNFPMPLAPAGLLAISGYANDADLRAAAAEILTEGGCRLYLPAVISQ